MELQRLHPDPAQTTAAEAAGAFREAAATAPADRPYVALNFAATADGRISIGGRSGPIGNEADRELFHELRVQADAVMAGAGTVGTERYGRLIRDPGRRERRSEAGLDPDPLAVVVSERLSLTSDIPLLQDPDSRVVIVTSSDTELEDVRAQVDYLRSPIAPALSTLRELHGIQVLLCEGGSVLAGALLRARLVDELFLSVAPKLAAGTGPTVVSGPPIDPPAEMELMSAHEAGGHLFLRYRIER